MHQLNSLIPRLRRGTGLALFCAVLAMAWTLSPANAADSKPVKEAKTETSPEKKSAKKKQLSGADLYATHCNRCHPERYATERTSAQWNTIMIHMRVRANLPSAEAKAILKYLQEDSGK